jgi:hypothetical protein
VAPRSSKKLNYPACLSIVSLTRQRLPGVGSQEEKSRPLMGQEKILPMMSPYFLCPRNSGMRIVAEDAKEFRLPTAYNIVPL